MPGIQLSWQPGFSLIRKPEKRPAPRRNRQQRFEFVVEHPQRAYRTRPALSVTAFTYSGSVPDPSREHSIVGDTRAYIQSEAVEGHGPPSDPSLGTSNHESATMGQRAPDLETAGRSGRASLYSCISEDKSASSHSPEPITGERNAAGPGPNTMEVSVLTSIPSPVFMHIPPTIEYTSLTQRFKPILNRCMRSV
jgi:hypothetical protein